MHQDFVWNSHCFPTATRESARLLLTDALKGMNEASDDRCTLFSIEFSTPRTQLLAPDYTYDDFLNELVDRDFELWLREVDDKTPSNSYLEEAIEDLTAVEFYFPDDGWPPSSDVLALAWHVNGAILSIASEPRWQEPNLKFAQHPTDGYALLSLPNISSLEHGKATRRHHEDLRNPPLSEQYDICSFDAEFEDWFNLQSLINQRRIRDKFDLAVARNFQGGKPLFDTLTSADGMRELRLLAFPGGAIRILFNSLPENRWGILVGILKKSDNEGYGEAISTAQARLAKMMRAHSC